jgi:hypothetical protein
MTLILPPVMMTTSWTSMIYPSPFKPLIVLKALASALLRVLLHLLARKRRPLRVGGNRARGLTI